MVNICKVQISILLWQTIKGYFLMCCPQPVSPFLRLAIGIKPFDASGRLSALVAMLVTFASVPDGSRQTWVANTAYALGDTVVPTIDNTYYYECTTAGTSDATTEPTWPTGTGATVADGTVVWTRQSTSALFKGYNQIEA